MNDILEREYFNLLSGGGVSRIAVVPIRSIETTTVRPGKIITAPVKKTVMPPTPDSLIGYAVPFEFSDLPEQVFVESPETILLTNFSRPEVTTLPKFPVASQVNTAIQAPVNNVRLGPDYSRHLMTPILVAIVIMGWWITNILWKKRKGSCPTTDVPRDQEKQEPTKTHNSFVSPNDGDVVVIVKSNKLCCEEQLHAPPTVKPFRLRSFSDAADENAYRRAQNTFKPDRFNSTYGGLTIPNSTKVNLAHHLNKSLDDIEISADRPTVSDHLIQAKH